MTRIVIAALLIFSTLLLYLSNKSSNHAPILDKFESFIQTSLSRDSAIVTDYLSSDNDRKILEKLNDSPFFIEIFINDSITYWTDQTTINETNKNSYALLQRVGDSLNYADIRLQIIDDQQNVPSTLLKDAGLSQTLSATTLRLPDNLITINELEINLTVNDGHKSPFAKGFAWLMLFAALVVFTTSRLQKIKVSQAPIHKKVLTSISTLVVLCLCKIAHLLPQFKVLFLGFSGFKILNNQSLISTTLCDLILNMWIFGSFIYLLNILLEGNPVSKKYQNLLAFLTGFVTLFSFGVSVYLIEGFVISSAVNLEIESLLQFNTTSFILIICFSVLMLLIFQWTHLMYELVQKSEQTQVYKYGTLLLGWVTGLGLLMSLGWLNVPIWIFVIFVVAYSLILDAYVENKAQKITYLIWWLIMFSGFLAINLFYFGLKKDIRDRTEFIDKYYTQSDPVIVKSLVAMQDSLIISGIFEKLSSLDMPSKLDIQDLDQYIFNDKEDISDTLQRSLELFDQKGNTLFNNHFANFHKTNQSFQNARQVATNLYHNPFEDKYIFRFTIAKTIYSNSNWYLFISHQNIQNNKNKFLADVRAKYSFVTFSKNKLIEKNEGNQSMPDINLISGLDTTQIKSGYSFVVSNPSSQYKIVSFKKVSGLIKPISLFSFIFTLSGLILLTLSLINTKFDFLPDNISLRFGSRSSLKTKIQLAIILLILVTFLIIGAITGYYFKNLIEANQLNKNREETTSIVQNIDSDIQNMADDESALTMLNTKLKEYSFVHNKELSLYDGQGKLIGSSLNGTNRIRLPFGIWDKIYHKNENPKLPNKYIKSDADYVPVYLNQVEPLAYIGITHKSFNNSSKSILDFLSTILNAYIFLFLIAGAIAITIANSITQPLSILAEKLKKFKLGKTNELLEWKSNDEIGTLIHDYNNLTHELERSAGIIAKTERDMAWREMAKQVAHEIKNPLTPMKLSIQYLDRTAKDNPDRAQELIPRISSTLIEQIDNLTQIANEFSNFATMPQASNEKVILNEIVEAIHDLFRKRDDMDINMIEPIDDLYVFADKNHLVRILNNLLKNAIQAIPETRRGKIEIELKRQGNDALIRITDNGTGIPDHMKDKVFTPNFTTKSSGTGLGLAISANMIESFNGRIYFETRVGSGTDFFVSIPLMRLDDYFGDENRVSLD